MKKRKGLTWLCREAHGRSTEGETGLRYPGAEKSPSVKVLEALVKGDHDCWTRDGEVPSERVREELKESSQREDSEEP